MQLVSEEIKPAYKKDVFDPTRDGATSAVVSRALRRVGRAEAQKVIAKKFNIACYSCVLGCVSFLEYSRKYGR